MSVFATPPDASVASAVLSIVEPPEPRSPTQLQTFERCPRRWSFEYQEGHRSPPTPSTLLGSAVHGQFERWFKTCERPDATTEPGRIAESGLHLWPAPQIVDEVEIAIGFGFEGCAYHGFQDLGFPDRGRRVVGDHKTTADFRYAKSADDLATDVQGTIYGTAAMLRHGVTEVELRWGYVRTRGARAARPVSVVLTIEKATETLRNRINPLYRAITASRGRRTLDLAPYVDACGDFGGCPHVSRCTMSEQERFKAIMSNQTFLEKLRGAQPLNPPESTLPPAPPVGVAAPAAPPPPAPFAAPASSPFAGFSAPPPPAARPAATPVAPPAPPPAPTFQGFAPPVPPSAPLPAAPSPFVAAPGTHPTGIATTFQGFAPPAPVAPSAPPAPVAPSAPPVPMGVPQPTVQAPVGAPAVVEFLSLLLVDCYPDTGMSAALDGGGVVAEANRRVCAAHGIQDWQTAEFGKGPGLLRVACASVLDDVRASGVTGAVTIDTDDAGQRACLPVFRQAAKSIIRGQR